MRKSKNKSVLYRYIVIGCLSVMIPLCLMIAFWARERGREYNRQMMDAENLMLIQMMEKAETEMSSLRKISEQIMLDHEITPYRLKNGGIYTVEALAKLKYYWQGTDSFDDLLICLNGDTEIYRSDGKEHFSTLSENVILSKSALSPEQLYELMDSKAYFGFLALSEQLKGGNTLVTYPLLSLGGERYGTLVGLISLDCFQEMLLVSDLASDTIICNSAGKILFSTDSQLRNTSELLEMLKNTQVQNGFYRIEFQNEKYQTVLHRSDMTEWYYIRMVNENELATRQRQEIQPLVGILFLISLLFTGTTGVLVAVYNYWPIRSLLRLFDANISYSAKRDELSLLDRYIRNLQTESSSMKQQLMDKELHQVRWLFTEILYGESIDGEEDRKLLEKYGFCEHVCEFCVVLMVLQDGALEEDFECRLKQMVSREFLFITREPGGGYICLYSSEQGTGLVEQKLEGLLGLLEDEGYHLRASMGHYTSMWGELRDSLNESMLAVELNSTSLIACLDSSFKNDVQEFWKPGKAELLLELVMRDGDKEEILKSSWKVEEELTRTLRYYRSNEVQHVFGRIMNYLVVYSKDIEKKENAKELFAAMTGCKEIKPFFMYFRKGVEQLFEDSSVFARVIKGRQMQEIKNFIDENFRLPEMSLSYIADQFAIRDSYLSKVFKENMGENFIDYLLRKRLEEAAKLLDETNMTVKQVVKSVGYEDVTSFTKKFSSKYGMTPGLYRKQLRANVKMEEKNK